MTSTITRLFKSGAATGLRDFAIQGAAEIGQCDGAQSFRAVRKRDGRQVLLHKFRPAELLTALGPLVGDTESPDFGRPFVTRFTDLFAVAGSAYLIEPLPPCTGLSDVWRHVLHTRPHQAVTVMAVLAKQMIAITRRLPSQGCCRETLDLNNLVLSPAGCFGALAACVECKGGIRWLRGDPQIPLRSDSRSLVEVLATLLDLDVEVAGLQNMPIRIPMDIHCRIRDLLRVIKLAELRPNRPVWS